LSIEATPTKDAKPNCSRPSFVRTAAISLASPRPQSARLKGVGDVDLRRAADDQMSDAGAARERAAVHPQHPEPKAVPVPMGEIDREVLSRRLRRAHAAHIAHHIGVEVQGDQIREVGLT
jgi:hypothetical protein